MELESKWLESKLMLDGMHWLTTPDGADPSRTREWLIRSQEQTDVPQTTTNEILPVVEVERARLSKRKSTPYIRASNVRASVERKNAVTKASDILNYTLDEVIKFPRVRRKAIFNDVVYGTGIITTEWLKDRRKLIRVPDPKVRKCANDSCGMLVAKPELELDQVKQMGRDQQQRLLQETSISLDGPPETKFSVGDKCPSCGAPMMRADMVDPEGEDAYGNPLGKDVPMGEVSQNATSPFDFFPENEGVGYDPGPLGMIGSPNSYAESRPESLDMLECLYEEGEDVRPDDPATIAQDYPIVGEYAATSLGWRSAVDRDIWQRHAIWRRYVAGPTKKYPLGRYIVAAGEKRLANGDLFVRCKEDKKLLIPRVQHSVCRFIPIDKEFWGQGLIEPLKSPQRRINMTFSQIVDNRERNGHDGWLLTDGMSIDSLGWESSGAGIILRWKPDVANPDKQPQAVASRLMHPEAYKEIEFTIQRLQSISGIQEVDQGQAGGMDNASALQLIADKSSERREDHEQDFIDCQKDSWGAVQLMLREFVREPREYWTKGANGIWKDGKFEGSELDGLTTVQIEEQPYVGDKRVFDRTLTLQSIEQGLIPVDTAYARREARREVGVANNISDQEAKQVEDAERKIDLFGSSMRVPAIEPTQDDHKTHWEVYGLWWRGEEGLAIKEKVGWDEVLGVIAGWRKDYDKRMLEQQMYDQAVESGALESTMNDAEASQAELGQVDPQMQKMIDRFAGFQPLPEATEKAVYVIMKTRLATYAQAKTAEFEALNVAAAESHRAALMVNPEAEPPIQQEWRDAETAKALDAVLEMYAVTESHNLLAELKMMQAVAAPTMAAPGAEATPSGTETTPGAAPAPAGAM